MNFFEDVKSILLEQGFSIEENAIIRFTKEFQTIVNQGTVIVNGVPQQVQQRAQCKVDFWMIGEGECDGESFDVIEVHLEHDGIPTGGYCEAFYHNDIPYFKRFLTSLLNGR